MGVCLRSEVALSLFFVYLKKIYEIELDEHDERIKLDVEECEINQKALRLLWDTTVQFKKLYMP